MNNDLSYESAWTSTVVLDDWIMPNYYDCKVFFNITTDNGEHQNIAFSRMQTFLEHIMNQSLIIAMSNPLLPFFKKKTGQKIVTLPNEPLDLIITNVLFTKLNCICEDKLEIEQIDLRSIQGENVWIHYDKDFAEGSNLGKVEVIELLSEKPWWFRSDASYSDWIEEKTKSTQYNKHEIPWEKDLQWSNDKIKSTTKNKWKPTIINGGKTQH